MILSLPKYTSYPIIPYQTGIAKVDPVGPTIDIDFPAGPIFVSVNPAGPVFVIVPPTGNTFTAGLLELDWLLRLDGDEQDDDSNSRM